MFDKPHFIDVIRLAARVLAVALFAFWGMFFLEHVWEWFIRPYPQMPPPVIWFNQLLHFLILAGLIVGFKWEGAGGVLVIVASVLFFIDKAPLFIPITILPGVLYLYCWYKTRMVDKNSPSGISHA